MEHADNSINRTYVRKNEKYLNQTTHNKIMIETILDSKVKTRTIKLLSERDEVFQVSDVARMLKTSKSRTSECLRELAEKGVLESRTIGRSVVYKLASNNLAKTVSKAVTQERSMLYEIQRKVVAETKKFKPVSLVLFGSALKGLKIGSDIDFLLLYDNSLEREKIYEIVGRLSERVGFRVSILPMRLKEFRSKAKKGEEFIVNVMANNRLLFGRDLEEVVWQG